GADTQIKDNIHDGAADAAHIFGLARRHIREMNPPDDTLVGNRAVDLCHRKPVTKVLGKLPPAEHFGEPAALILPYPGRVQPRSANFELFHKRAPIAYSSR